MTKATLSMKGNRGLLTLDLDGDITQRSIVATGPNPNDRCVMTRANRLVEQLTEGKLCVQMWMPASGTPKHSPTWGVFTTLLARDPINIF